MRRPTVREGLTLAAGAGLSLASWGLILAFVVGRA